VRVVGGVKQNIYWHHNLSKRLVVDERKSGDEVVKTVVVSGQSLAVVTGQFEEGQHSKTSVLEFLCLTLEVFFGFQVKVTNIEATEVSGGLNDTNGPDNLQPSQKRNHADGGVSGRDRVEWDSGGDVTGKVVGLGGDVSQNGQHANASVFQFGQSVLVESFLGDTSGKVGRVPESDRSDNSGFVLVFASSERGDTLGGGARSKGGGGGQKGGKNTGRLHGLI